MIQYQDIHQHLRATELLRGDTRWLQEEQRQASTLIQFTTSTSAPQHSQHNLAWILGLAREHGVDIAVIKSCSVQFLGDHRVIEALRQVFPVSWVQEYQDYSGQSYGGSMRSDSTALGTYAGIYLYSNCLVMPQHQGVYNIATGTRLRQRRAIIQEFWDRGFATRRGRILGVAETRWTGSREELQAARQLYDQYYLRRDRSAVANKICQAYTSTVRYYAWPNNW